jgi:phage terminase large subunit-like protein
LDNSFCFVCSGHGEIFEMTGTTADEQAEAIAIANAFADPNLSVMDQLARLPDEQRLEILGGMDINDPEILHSWDFWSRPKQRTPEGNWRIWLILAGRGFGKTRTGAEFIREQVNQGKAKHIALVGPTAATVRDTMVEGESGLLKIFPKDERPRYEPSKRRITFRNGAVASAFSADEPDRLRGPNHDCAWADELAAWRYPDAWDMLMLGLRIGIHPQACVTTTPKPVRTVRQLLAINDGTVQITRGSTYENQQNLAKSFMHEILNRYEGTRLGRQELHAEVLDDVEGALWVREDIDKFRVVDHPDLTRVVVAVDPATTSNKSSAETGIVVAGVSAEGHGYVLDDRSIRGTPLEWGTAAVSAYHRNNADRIVAESNQGGEMVSHTLRMVEPNVPVKLVHASRGKQTRAEPVAALYEQGKIHHVGYLSDLEDQLCSWVPHEGPSPDRLDAVVWALTELMVSGKRQVSAFVPISMEQANPWIPR